MGIPAPLDRRSNSPATTVQSADPPGRGGGGGRGPKILGDYRVPPLIWHFGKSRISEHRRMITVRYKSNARDDCFALRGFGYSHAQLGAGDFGMDLTGTLHRKPRLMRRWLYRQGIRFALTIRLVYGMDAARWV